MERLYAPWRTNYAEKIDKTKSDSTEDCLFCHIPKEEADENNFILRRFKHNYVILNRFPYNAGHLLIVPFQHINSLDSAHQETRIEIIELASASSKILKETISAQGINLGINFGKAAGAGIPSHLHMHILPRWVGDTNFLPTLAQTKQISVDLYKIYNDLKPAFAGLKEIL